jgi:hypothetical protein
MVAIERQAVKRAILRERQSWLPVLQGWLATFLADGDLVAKVWLEAEVRRLCRLLGVRWRSLPSPEGRRPSEYGRVFAAQLLAISEGPTCSRFPPRRKTRRFHLAVVQLRRAGNRRSAPGCRA